MRFGLLVLLPVFGTACAPVDRLRERFFDGPTPHDRYVQMLDWAGLRGTALAEDWIAAGDSALAEALAVPAPHVEEAWLPAEQPSALALRVAVRRGQVLGIEAELGADSAALLFIDAFRVTDDTLAPFRHEASADSAARRLEVEPRRDGDYVVRVQPELLRGGRITVRIRIDASLAFPVQGRGSSDIGSRFGAPRDGGARDHHGVDIFAPRGTPALAAAHARVARVQETPIGGKVVWLRDERRNQSLYYAHLDSQYVTTGMVLRPGDTIGFVGNTGNARTTPPHLHFGVYRRGEGPVDPWPFVDRVRRQPPALAASPEPLGRWARAARDRVRLRPAADAASEPATELPRHTAMRVLAATGAWYRVRLPDGALGYVAADQTESADLPLRSAVLASAQSVHSAPRLDTDVLERVETGDSLAVLGRFGDFYLVRSPRGPTAWLPGQ
jgi:murein DD-endopeptidase MepM/ murein hydrolase activator NlpD